jgi:ParB-like chromosome segregation protein Spo0J
VKTRAPRRQSAIRNIDPGNLWPAPENDQLYRKIDPEDPAVVALAESIARDGLLEPVVATSDGYILSGHRRHVAAKLAGLSTIPCRVMRFSRHAEPERFLRLLRQYNNQREKTRDEKLREAVVDLNPDLEHEALVEHRLRAVTPRRCRR